MSASVVTFSNQMGSGGSIISRAVAQKLRFRFYDWEIIAQAAQEAGVSPEVLAVASSERSPGFLERMMSRLAGLTTGDEPGSASAALSPSLLNSDDYRQFLEHVVRQLGSQGDAVIVNRAGQFLLRDTSGVLKVLLFGSLERRVARFAATQGLRPEDVRPTIDDSDRQRSEFFKHIYHTQWLSSDHYDLAINTDHVSPELAADMVAAAAKEMA